MCWRKARTPGLWLLSITRASKLWTPLRILWAMACKTCGACAVELTRGRRRWTRKCVVIEWAANERRPGKTDSRGAAESAEPWGVARSGCRGNGRQFGLRRDAPALGEIQGREG